MNLTPTDYAVLTGITFVIAMALGIAWGALAMGKHADQQTGADMDTDNAYWEQLNLAIELYASVRNPGDPSWNTLPQRVQQHFLGLVVEMQLRGLDEWPLMPVTQVEQMVEGKQLRGGVA